MIKFLRENVYAGAALLLIRFYLGYQWMTHGIEKLRGGFDATGFLKGAVDNPVMDHATNAPVYPTFLAFLEHFALPNAKLFNILIPVGETLVGLGLILGALTTAAVFFGLLMNFMFLFAGTVSTNPWMIVVGLVILIAGANAGRFGADRWALPLLGKVFHLQHKEHEQHQKAA